MTKFPKILLVFTLNFALLFALFFLLKPAQASSFPVTNTNDSGPGSLRRALADAALAAGPDAITFDPSLNGQTITLTSGTLVISSEVDIDASNLTDTIRVSGNHITRVFSIDAFTVVTMTRLTIADGRTPTGVGVCSIYCGGGVYVDFSGKLTLNDSIVTNNFGNSAGGIGAFLANLTIHRSRIISNSANFDGGGLSISSGEVTIRDSQILSNSGNGGGGGLFATNLSDLRIISSTIADNVANSSSGGGIATRYTNRITILNSTVASNTADFNGGGIEELGLLVFPNGYVELANNTISANQAISNGGAIYAKSEFGAGLVLTLTNNTVAGNSSGIAVITETGGIVTPTVRNTLIAGSSGPNCVDVTGDSSNLSDDVTCTGFTQGNPRLAPLADNGGPTPTHLPTTQSDAMGNGNTAFCQAAPVNGLDQRGEVRSPLACDIGAAEVPDTVFVPTVTVTIQPPVQVVAAGANANFTVTVANGGTVTLTNLAVSNAPATCNRASGILSDLPIGGSTSYGCLSPINSSTIITAVAQAQPLIDGVPTSPTVTATSTVEVIVAELTITKTAFVAGYREQTSPGVFNPSDCALASNITVPVNSPVKYCYTVTNSGDYTLTHHTLVDSHFVGAILNSLPYTLAPGATVSTVDAGEIPTRTLTLTTTNVATWTASIAPLNNVTPTQPVTAIISATVLISGPTLDQDGDGFLDNDEGAGDLDDDGIPNYLDDDDGRSVPDPDLLLPKIRKSAADD